MRTEKVLAGLGLTGFILKMFHIPGSSVLIVVSLTALSLIYCWFSFYFLSNKTIKDQNLPLSIIAGFFFSLAPIAVVFKLQYWPGASVLLLCAFISAGIFAFVGYINKNQATESLVTYYKQFFTRSLVLTIVAGALYLTPVKTLIKVQDWRDPEFARLKIQAYENPANEEYQQALKDYWDKKDGIK